MHAVLSKSLIAALMAAFALGAFPVAAMAQSQAHCWTSTEGAYPCTILESETEDGLRVLELSAPDKPSYAWFMIEDDVVGVLRNDAETGVFQFPVLFDLDSATGCLRERHGGSGFEICAGIEEAESDPS